MKIKLKILFLVILALMISSCASSRKSLKPDNSEKSYYHYILAIEAEFDRDWDEAITQMELAIREDPYSPYLKLELSTIYLKMERIDESVKIAEDIINEYPDYEPVLAMLSKL